jgi:hypothetical protein
MPLLRDYSKPHFLNLAVRGKFA